MRHTYITRLNFICAYVKYIPLVKNKYQTLVASQFEILPKSVENCISCNPILMVFITIFVNPWKKAFSPEVVSLSVYKIQLQYCTAAIKPAVCRNESHLLVPTGHMADTPPSVCAAANTVLADFPRQTNYLQLGCAVIFASKRNEAKRKRKFFASMRKK